MLHRADFQENDMAGYRVAAAAVSKNKESRRRIQRRYSQRWGFFVAGVVSLISLGIGGCGAEQSKVTHPPQFGFSTRFLGVIGECQAVLFGENRVLFHSKCIGERVWFNARDELKPYSIVERMDKEGLAIATLSSAVQPRYASLDINDNGQDRRNVTIYGDGFSGECEAKRDGSHNCKCAEETHPALVYSGYVIGIVERCESLERSGVYIPLYMLSATSS